MSETSRRRVPPESDSDLARTVEVLLSEPEAWEAGTLGMDGAAPKALRERLLSRLRASVSASRPMVHARLRHMATPSGGTGGDVVDHQLYRAEQAAPRRAGEPERVRLLRLGPGATLPAPSTDPTWLLELLMLRGELSGPQGRSDDPEPLRVLDFVASAAGRGAQAWRAGPEGALFYLRESRSEAAPELPRVVRDAAGHWEDFAPGIRRRVLWREGPLAAMLYQTEPGAMVPHHGHGHDEECLSVRGEVFADDVLLTEGDYQLAPAGSEHRCVSTDTGGVVYLHGDIDLALK